MWQKRISTPKWYPIERKTKKFVTTIRGPHGIAIPLQVLVRDIFKLAETAREARIIIKKGQILVDGKKRKDPKFGVGLLDVIEIPNLRKAWRVLFKDGFDFVETSGEDSKLKICKIIDKTILKGAKTQLNLNDGKNILTDKSFSTDDSLLIKIPDHEIVDHLKFEKGAVVLVTGGKNAGTIAKIKEIEKNRVWLEQEKKTFEVPKDYVIVVGKEKPLIKLT